MCGKITAILLALLYVFCMPGFLSAQKTTKPHLEYQFWYNDSGVVDRDEILSWTLAGTETLNFVGDRLILGSASGGQTANERLMRLGIAGVLLFPFHDTFNIAGHEYGHFRAYSRMGMSNFEFRERANSERRRKATPLIAVEIMFNSYWLGGTRYNASAAPEEWVRARRQYTDRQWTDARTLGEAGGLNQDQYTAKHFARKVQRGHAHILDAIPYADGATSVMRYPTNDGSEEYGGDLFDYRELLHERGIETDFREIKGVSLFAGVASGATLAFVRSWYRYIVSGSRGVEPFALSFGNSNLYWPEFASYLSLLGPTLKTDLRFAFGQSGFGGLPKSNTRMSYERALPTGTEEYGLGVSISLPRIAGISFRLGFAAYRNPAHNGEWREYEAEAASFGNFSIGARLSEGNSYTFRRERVGTAFSFVQEHEKSAKFFARVSISY